ncbi:MAG: HIT family protein [Candidatus Neomarinimicrobiota bacterium]|jgi:ATP adenylyltransferase
MDNLWAPWRMQYVRAPKKNTKETFLKKLEDGNDEENLVLFRGEHSFVCMNLYPYNNGHIMILPNNIVEKPEELDDVTQFEIMKIASLSMKIIREKMNAEGFNFGANIGASAGAGIAEHLHFHIVPRWKGDTNFMPVIGNTKVHVQGLNDTYVMLRPLFKNMDLSQ